MTANKLLLDASFIIAWLKISDLEIPKEVLGKVIGADLFSAFVCRYEVGNTILKYKKYLDKNMDSSFLFEQVESLDISYLDIKNSNFILEVAEKYNLSFYDASYFALMLESPEIDSLLTFDRDFSKVKSSKIQVLI